jgi:hypothetical protein
MAYLAKDDYTLRISVLHLDQILAEAMETSGLTADNIRTNAESWAMATVKSYLSSQWNIAAEYAQTGGGRNYQIMQITIDLVLCTIHKTINPRDVPEHVEKACEDAIQWLKDVRDEKISVDLTPAAVAEGEVDLSSTFLDSQQKFISKPFTDKSLTDSNL